MEGNGIRSLFDLLIISAEMIISAIPILPWRRTKGWAEGAVGKYINRKKILLLFRPQMTSLSPSRACSQPTSASLHCTFLILYTHEGTYTLTHSQTQRHSAWRLLSVILFSWHNPDWFVQQIKTGSTSALLLGGLEHNTSFYSATM